MKSASGQVGVAERLRIERRRLGLTQVELAGLAGVSHATQVAYEGGSTSPNSHYLEILHSLGADTGWIISGKRGSTPDWELVEDLVELIEEWSASLPVHPTAREKTARLRALYEKYSNRERVDVQHVRLLLSIAS